MKTAKSDLPSLVLLDSSCWLEFFVDSERAELFAPAIDRIERVVVPVIVLYEVTKKLLRVNEEIAARALALLKQGISVAIDSELAISAATNGLPLADSLIYACGQSLGAEIWTQDEHFRGLAGVRYFVK